MSQIGKKIFVQNFAKKFLTAATQVWYNFRRPAPGYVNRGPVQYTKRRPYRLRASAIFSHTVQIMIVLLSSKPYLLIAASIIFSNIFFFSSLLMIISYHIFSKLSRLFCKIPFLFFCHSLLRF